MSKKISILIIFLIFFGFLFFNFRKIEEVEAVTTWFEATCSLSSNTWACYDDFMLSCTATKCRNSGTYNCVKTCIPRNNATASSANCALNPSSQSTMPCTCAGVNLCAGESGTCTITTNRCDYTCLANYENCDGNNANGCECQRPGPACGGAGNNTRYYNCNICDGTSCNTLVDAAHCLSENCDNTTHTQICSAGSCVACSAGTANCDLNSANGCETNLNTDPNNCGSCGHVCEVGECRDGECLKPNLYGFAWSENIGWISFNSRNCDVDGDGTYEGSNEGGGATPAPAGCPTSGTVHPYGVYLPKFDAQGDPVGDPDYSDYFKGFAWSPNIGWIKFNPPLADIENLVPPDNYHRSPAYLLNRNVYGFIRACAGAANADCTGGVNPASGGWDGFINTNSGGAFPHKVELYQDAVTGKWTFKGWAWGGGGSDLSNAVIGWISWNCKDREAATGKTCVDNVTDPNTQLWNYKVTYEPENQTPTISNPTTNLDSCCYGCPHQVAQGLSVTFNWTYSDPDGNPETAYEILLDNDTTDPNSPVGTYFHLVVDPSNGSTSYTIDLSQNQDGAWLSQLAWNTTYGWWVRVRDEPGAWSQWSDADPSDPDKDPATFHTPAHAAPYVNFSWCPTYPAVYQSTQFCSVTEAGVCDAATCAPPTDETECYDAAGNVVNCANWSWVFTHATSPLDSTPPAEISGSTFEYRNPREIKFQSSGSKNVTLTVTDSAPTSYQCTKTLPVNVGLPLPQWKEIPPTF
jgi:hypothetical protein